MMLKKTVVNELIAAAVTVGNGVVSLMSGLMAASLILYSGYVLYDTAYVQNQAFSSGWDLLQYRPEILEDGATPLAGADTLAKINKDYRAWLTVFDTKIDYPVMQGEDDLYYASHDVHGKSSLTGAIYLAAGNSGDMSDNYNIIYGHHMDNNAMFGGLDKFKTESYFNSHREGVLIAPDGVYDLEMFAVLETDAYDSNVYTVGNRNLADVRSYLQQKASIYNAQVAGSAEQIVALSTCMNAETNGRLIVFARMTKRTAPPPPDDDDDDDDPDNPEPVVPGPVNPTPPGPDNPDTPVNPDTPGTPPNTPNPPTFPENTTPEGPVIEEIDEPETPLAQIIRGFIPRGSVYGKRCWALVNLICVFVTAYILLPLLHLKDKYGRSKMMKKINVSKEELREAKRLQKLQREERDLIEKTALENREKSRSAMIGEITVDEFIDAVENLYYKVREFSRHFTVGVLLEAFDVVLAIIVFLLTEDIRLPMVLIDRWTPLMLLMLIVCLAIDILLAQYRKQVLAEELYDVKKQAEQANANA